MLNILQKNFRIKPLTAAVASVISLTTASMVYAQDEGEEIVVTGIKASLQAAMDIKRDSAGVVDAISAEDIGKFPDTNLAESLQRITGVSIDRSNGEGSKITVRGFGPDYNMVTLNGRTMPSGSAYGGSSGADASTNGGNSRAFDFANLSSDSIAGVEVYKTGKANIAAGGIGATVNIKTARPLDTSGLKASIGGKAVMDTTNRTGSDVTPEVSGLVSWSDDSSMFGVALSASYAERDSGYTGATVNDWSVERWAGGDANTLWSIPANDPAFKNAPAVGQLYARPNDVRYSFADQQRERTNAQLTLQYRPIENLTATLDYTYAQKDQSEHRGEVTTWLQKGAYTTLVEFDNSAIKTPKFVSEDYAAKGAAVDTGFAQQYREQQDTLESTGLNVDWAVNDQLTVTLDAHHSTMESVPTGPGHSGELDVGIGSVVKTSANWQFSGAEIPTWTQTNKSDLAGSLSSSVLRVWSVEQLSTVDQGQVNAKWKFDDGGSFDFGIERREMSSNTINYNGNNPQILGGWGASAPGEFPADLFEPFDVAGEFNDASTGNSPHIGFRADARELANFLVSKYNGELLPKVNPADPDEKPRYEPIGYIGIEDTQVPGQIRNSKSNNDVEENTDAVYFQLGNKGTIGGIEVDMLAGLRYENTKQVSSSDTPLVDYFVWASDNDFTAVSGAAGSKVSVNNDYDLFLPNLDLSAKLSDNLVARFSYSKTIARPTLSNLDASVSGYGINGSSLNVGTSVKANANTPTLQPLQSSNIDISVEWYFDDASYVSAGVFQKQVTNFVGNENTQQTIGTIRDQTAGPRAQAAFAELEANGFSTDDQHIFAMMNFLAHPDIWGAPAGMTDADVAELATTKTAYQILPAADDPLMQFDVTVPVNNHEAKIYGAEFAGQHFFGDTGFGLQANYTIVRGDVHFDNQIIDANQFALLGLSDTANLVAMYEKYGIEARVAYNWRDTYLSRTGWGSGNPGYVEAHSQIDMNVTYHITDDLSVSLEGINITGEDRREHARNSDMMIGYDDLGARYQAGVRYNF